MSFRSQQSIKLADGGFISCTTANRVDNHTRTEILGDGAGKDRRACRRARAKPVTAGAHQGSGTALEGNLESKTVDRDIILFLPPGYAKQKSRRSPAS